MIAAAVGWGGPEDAEEQEGWGICCSDAMRSRGGNGMIHSIRDLFDEEIIFSSQLWKSTKQTSHGHRHSPCEVQGEDVAAARPQPGQLAV